MTDEQSLLSQANRLLREGRIEEAIAAFQQLLSVQPNLPDSWFNLAYLQRCARRFDDALASYDQAIRRGVEAPEEVHLNRAAIFSEHLGRTDEAHAELETALRLNPRFVPAWLNLGNLHEDRGDAARARAAYERVLMFEPSNSRALARLSVIDAFEGHPAANLERIRQALDLPGLSGEQRSELAFAAGHALDAMGEYRQAFALFEMANRTALQSVPPSYRYDRAAHERFIAALIETFPLGATAQEGAGGEAPIFICGMFRSGSTLAEQMLGRHSQVMAGGELDYLPALVHRPLHPYPQSLFGVSGERLDQLRGAYLGNLHDVFPTGRVTDKRPDNFLHIGLIKAMFPEAKIVHTVRSPLDNILSIYSLHFDDSVGYGFDLGDIVHWYRQYLRLMAHWTAVFPGDIHHLPYDEMVREPRRTMAGVLDFCGLGWEEGVLAADAAPETVRTASVWQVRQPLHGRSSGRWRNYAEQLEEVAALLGISPEDAPGRQP
jgi:cytochrome c-type biogenesis protein CcmH/NrfG